MNTTTTRIQSILSPETAARVAEIDDVLDLAPGQGFAEEVMSSLLRCIADGDFGSVIGGWDFEHGDEWAEKKLIQLSECWKAEGISF
jgi:hypothetical protein